MHASLVSPLVRLSRASLLGSALAISACSGAATSSTNAPPSGDGPGGNAASSSGTGSSGGAGAGTGSSGGTGAGSSSGGSIGAGSSGAVSGSSSGSPVGGSNGTGTGSGAASSSGSSSGSPSGSSSGAPSGSSSGAAASVWIPSPTQPIHFHWQLSDNFAAADVLSGQAGQVVYDIDGQNATAADVASIHAAGAIAVCYVDVGTLEQGRPDFSDFPASVVGPGVQGWPGENWLLVTAANQSTILPLMKARFENWCQAKGFDAIEPDNLDAFTNISGVTEADNIAYDVAIAGLAQGLSLSIGLKNLLASASASNVPSLLANFDWALAEQCYEYNECNVYTQAGSFIAAGKAVWDVEYNVDPTCAQANAGYLNAQRRDLNLVAPTTSGYTYSPCVPDSQTTW